MISLYLAAALAVQSASPVAQTLAVEPIPRPEQILAIPDELRTAFQLEVLDTTRFQQDRLERLVRFVFGKDSLGVTYTSDATQTVAASFRSREVNCLSSALMIVALAREAGLKAHAQQVSKVVTWDLRDDVVVQSQHVNAIVELGSGRRYVIDVDASDAIATDALNPISDQQLLAYFYGNRAMELLVERRLPEAGTWLDEALRLAPKDPLLRNNAGVMSLRMGDEEAAERHFLEALHKDPDQISALSNLIALYQRRGDGLRAAKWQARADKVLRNAPYYQFDLGRQREQSGDTQGAIQFYRRAIALNRSEHRFYFALAQAYLAMGRRDKANREMARALEHSHGTAREEYQGKLVMLRRRGL